MTKDKIIALARDATAPEWWDNEDGWHMGMDLQRFADSVAAAAVAAEREACARVCDDASNYLDCKAEELRAEAAETGDYSHIEKLHLASGQLIICGESIRARSVS